MAKADGRRPAFAGAPMPSGPIAPLAPAAPTGPASAPAVAPAAGPASAPAVAPSAPAPSGSGAVAPSAPVAPAMAPAAPSGPAAPSAPMAPAVPMALSRPAAEAFLYREARLLDERRFEDWLALFTADGHYIVPGGDVQDPDGGVPLIDDDRPTLEDRIERLRSPAAHAQSPPSRTVHVVGNVEVEGPHIHSTLLIHEARAGQTRAFAARCRHLLRWEGDQWRIAEKRVHLVNSDHPLYNLTFLL